MQISTFETFHREMFGRLTRYASRLADPATAEDAAAMALHTVWKKDLPEPRDDDELRGLQSLAYRIVEGHLRNLARAERSRSKMVSGVIDIARVGPDHEPDIADLVCADGAPDWLADLSVTERQVLSLVYDGFSVSEIAPILGCSPGAVSMRLNRARKHVQHVLEERGVIR